MLFRHSMSALRVLGVVAVLSLLAAACSDSPAELGESAESSTESSSAPDTTSAAEKTTASVDLPGFDSWDEVLEAADGSTVRWFMWGGNDNLNQFVDNVYAPELKKLGITLERVPLEDTATAVADVIKETEASDDPGTIDLIWINGDNAATLADQNLLLEGWSRALPNATFVDFDGPAGSDFGRDIGDTQSPWASAQLQLVYDTDRVDESDLPTSFAELQEYACANEGRVTYVSPEDFHGARFLNGALSELAEDSESLAAFDEDTWNTEGEKLWSWLNEWESCLWREGATYPETDVELHQLLANDEVDFSITLAVGGAAPLIEDGTLPPSAQAFVFDQGMVVDSSYVAIPTNAPNAAGAWVVANLLLEPEFQAQQIAADNGGSGLAIDPALVTEPEAAAALDEAIGNLPAGSLSPEELETSATPAAASEYQTRLGEEWRPNVVES